MRRIGYPEDIIKGPFGDGTLRSMEIYPKSPPSPADIAGIRADFNAIKTRIENGEKLQPD